MNEVEKYIAIISLFPTRYGGRSTPILNTYWPNGVLGFEDDLESLWSDNYYKYVDPDTDQIKNVDFKILIDGGREIYPGRPGLVEIHIPKLASEYLGTHLLRPGVSFLLREGGRVIGTGEFLKLKFT